MDENQRVRQTALEANMFTEKRKRKDGRNELDGGTRRNIQAFSKVKEMARLRRSVRRLNVAAKSRDKISISQEGEKYEDEEGRSTTPKDIVIQVDSTVPRERKLQFVDEVQNGKSPDRKAQICGRSKLYSRKRTNTVFSTPLVALLKEQKYNFLYSKREKSPDAEVDTVSDIMDNEMAVEDLDSEGEDPKEVRLRLLNLRETDSIVNEKRHRSYLSTSKHRKPLPPNAKTLQACSAARKKYKEEQLMPMAQNDLRMQSLPTLEGIILKHHPEIWKDADGDSANTDSFDLNSLKQSMMESRWIKLLEELYRDKKYFDYVIKTKTPTEGDILAKVSDGLGFLYERSIFWEQQEPIPPRPPPYVLEKYRNNTHFPRTAARKTASTERPARMPITQVSKLKKRAENSQAEEKKADEKQADEKKTEEHKKPAEDQIEWDAIPLIDFNFEKEKTRDFKYESEKTTLSILPTRESLNNRKDLYFKLNTDVWEPITVTNVKDEHFSKNDKDGASVIEINVKRNPGHSDASNGHDSFKAENFPEPAQWASRKQQALIKTRIRSSFRRKKEPDWHPRVKSAGNAVLKVTFEGGDGEDKTVVMV